MTLHEIKQAFQAYVAVFEAYEKGDNVTVADLKESVANATCEAVQAHSGANLKNRLTPKELRLLNVDRQKIAAIKEVRSRTGLGLKEAKDLVERFQE